MERECRYLVRRRLKLFKKEIFAKVPPIPFLSVQIGEEIRLFNDWLSAFVRNRPDVRLLNTFDVYLDPTSKTPETWFSHGFEKNQHFGTKNFSFFP